MLDTFDQISNHFKSQAKSGEWLSAVPSASLQLGWSSSSALLGFLGYYLCNADFHSKETQEQHISRLRTVHALLSLCKEHDNGVTTASAQTLWVISYLSLCEQSTQLAGLLHIEGEQLCNQIGSITRKIKNSENIQSAYEILIAHYKKTVEQKPDSNTFLTMLCLSYTFRETWVANSPDTQYKTVCNQLFYGARILFFGVRSILYERSRVLSELTSIQVYTPPVGTYTDAQEKLLEDALAAMQDLTAGRNRFRKMMANFGGILIYSDWGDIMKAIGERRFAKAKELLDSLEKEVKTFPKQQGCLSLIRAYTHLQEGEKQQAMFELKKLSTGSFTTELNKARLLFQCGNSDAAVTTLEELNTTEDSYLFLHDRLKEEIGYVGKPSDIEPMEVAGATAVDSSHCQPIEDDEQADDAEVAEYFKLMAGHNKLHKEYMSKLDEVAQLKSVNQQLQKEKESLRTELVTRGVVVGLTEVEDSRSEIQHQHQLLTMRKSKDDLEDRLKKLQGDFDKREKDFKHQLETAEKKNKKLSEEAQKKCESISG